MPVIVVGALLSRHPAVICSIPNTDGNLGAEARMNRKPDMTSSLTQHTDQGLRLAFRSKFINPIMLKMPPTNRKIFLFYS